MILLRHNFSRKCPKIVKFVSITHSERTFGIVLQSLLPSRGKSVIQCWREMAASPSERSWCVLEFARCNSFVAVRRAFRRQFGRPGPPETSIRRWYEQFRYRGCICHQGRSTDNTFCTWPPWSPDLTVCDFFLWGFVKHNVYDPPLPKTLPELRERINTAIENVTQDMLWRVWREWEYRLDICRVTRGAHIECI